MITAGQMRAARALLGIDQRKLADLARLSLPTIQRMEASEDTIRGNVDSLMKLVAALKESNDYCAKAYRLTDAATAGMVDVFGQQRSKMYALLMNVTHDNEHYGNIVTYMRMNKLVPPSSRPRPSGG